MSVQCHFGTVSRQSLTNIDRGCWLHCAGAAPVAAGPPVIDQQALQAAQQAAQLAWQQRVSGAQQVCNAHIHQVCYWVTGCFAAGRTCGLSLCAWHVFARGG